MSNQTIWIGLWRGLNVGGHNRLAMADLRAVLDRLGHAPARTLVQSGNAVFRGRSGDPASLVATIREAVRLDTGIDTALVVLSARDLRAVLAANPFPDATQQPSSLHAFLSTDGALELDSAGVDRLRQTDEAVTRTEHAIWLHTPQGYGRSKLAAALPSLCGTAVTARNWRTLTRLAGLAEEIEGTGAE
ncbi:DUF1697 domain-containing protein [Maricaulis sp. CAU 1757]